MHSLGSITFGSEFVYVQLYKASPDLRSKVYGSSDPCVLIGRRAHAIDGEPAPSLLFLCAHPGVLTGARPFPVFCPLRQAATHRVQVDVLRPLRTGARNGRVPRNSGEIGTAGRSGR